MKNKITSPKPKAQACLSCSSADAEYGRESGSGSGSEFKFPMWRKTKNKTTYSCLLHLQIAKYLHPLCYVRPRPYSLYRPKLNLLNNIYTHYIMSEPGQSSTHLIIGSKRLCLDRVQGLKTKSKFSQMKAEFWMDLAHEYPCSRMISSRWVGSITGLRT